MKTYIDKNFDRESLKKIDIQQVGVYYDVPKENIKEEKLIELDYTGDDEIETLCLDKNTIDDTDYIEKWDNVEYAYTDEVEIEDFLHDLMNYKAYDHYLVVLFGATWTGSDGYKIFSKYDECFYRDYDVTMYVTGSSAKGKYLQLREYHHDRPTGHTSIIIGLTNAEYERLDNQDINEIIAYERQALGKVVEI